MRCYAQILNEIAPLGLSKPGKMAFTTYFGYARGQILSGPIDGRFATANDAVNAGACSTETYFDEPAFQAALQSYQKLNALVSKAFHDELRAEYSEISDKIFDIAYSWAYEDGHAYGMDEVANYMIGYVDRAMSVVSVTLNG